MIIEKLPKCEENTLKNFLKKNFIGKKTIISLHFSGKIRYLT